MLKTLLFVVKVAASMQSTAWHRTLLYGTNHESRLGIPCVFLL